VAATVRIEFRALGESASILDELGNAPVTIDILATAPIEGATPGDVVFESGTIVPERSRERQLRWTRSAALRKEEVQEAVQEVLRSRFRDDEPEPSPEG
jgi:hypothetical protein